MSYFLAGNQKDGRLGPQEIPTVLGTLHTVAEPLLLKTIVLSNTNAAARTVAVHVVPSGSVASDATKVVPDINVPNDDTLTPLDSVNGIPLSLNDKIQYVASGAGVNIIIVLSRRGR